MNGEEYVKLQKQIYELAKKVQDFDLDGYTDILIEAQKISPRFDNALAKHVPSELKRASVSDVLIEEMKMANGLKEFKTAFLRHLEITKKIFEKKTQLAVTTDDESCNP